VRIALILYADSRMVASWQASRSLRSDLAIDALEMVVWNRQRTRRVVQRALQMGIPLPAGPCRGLDDIEFATMTYADLFNHRRRHGEVTNNPIYTTPAELGAAYYGQNPIVLEAVTQ
jgi:putative transposase